MKTYKFTIVDCHDNVTRTNDFKKAQRACKNRKLVLDDEEREIINIDDDGTICY